MKTNNEKNAFVEGFLIGIAVCLIVCVIIVSFYMLVHPIERVHPNTLLNSPDYCIDTVKTIIGNDTTIEYSFKYKYLK